jgi:triosephosphate isomerase
MNKKIILNHKSNLNYDEILKYKNDIETFNCSHEIIIFPSIMYLPLFKDSKYKIGTQNFFSENYGSYTGEINLESIRYLNINYTLIGHSERIKYDLDNKKNIKAKLNSSLKLGFNTILCIGEINRKTKATNYVKKQLEYYLKDIPDDFIKNLKIAYEPAWAIGGTESLEYSKISEIIKFIKKYFLKKYNCEIEVYYGGSVTENSVEEIINVCDGVLIGGLSANISKIKVIIDKFC